MLILVAVLKAKTFATIYRFLLFPFNVQGPLWALSLAPHGPRSDQACPGPIMGSTLGPPLGHAGPKLAQGPLWAQSWAPMGHDGPKLAQGLYGPKLGPPMGHDGPMLAQGLL